MKLFLRYSLLVIPFLLITPFVITIYESSYAYKKTIKVETQSSTEAMFQAYANQITESVPEDEVVVIVVPLNGTPDSILHPSFKNANVSLEVLRRISNRQKVLVLSEGYQRGNCTSGADITLYLLALNTGYNEHNDVTVLLERDASTTFENIIFSKKIVTDFLHDKNAVIFIAGMSDTIYGKSGRDVGFDIGHGARAFILAKQNWRNQVNSVLKGFLPTNKIDPSVQNYSRKYNFLTMFAGANGLLSLSPFDKNTDMTVNSNCSTQ